MTRIVADNEGDVIGARRAVCPYDLGEIDPGHCGRGDVPVGRHSPIPTVDQIDVGVHQTRRLVLRELVRGLDNGLYQPRAVALVVPHSIDVQPVGRGVCLDLEGDGLALVDADVGREADKVVIAGRAIAGWRQIPLRTRSTWKGIFYND